MTQTFQVITLEVTEDHVDLVSGLLHNEGSLGVEEIKAGNNVRLKSYHSEDTIVPTLVSSVQDYCPQCQLIDSVKISLSQIPFQAASFEPIELTQDIWIVPPDDMPTETKIESGRSLIIRPGAAFGTGRHESTQLASENLFQNKPLATSHKSLLDIGTGSGVLSILGKMIGFDPVVAVEIDDEARVNAAENFELNGYVDIKLFDNLNKIEGSYDVIVANILAPTLIYLKTRMLHLLAPGGTLIMSGLVVSEEEAVKKSFEDTKYIARLQRNEWVSLVYGKK